MHLFTLDVHRTKSFTYSPLDGLLLNLTLVLRQIKTFKIELDAGTR